MFGMELRPDWAFAFCTWFADKLLPPIILAVVVSWIIPRAIERYRGRRDHFYKTVDALRDQVLAFQKVGSEYWLSDRTRPAARLKESELNFRIQQITGLLRLASTISDKELYDGPGSPGVAAVSKLMEAATEAGTPPAGATPRTHRPDKASQVNAAANELVALVMQRRWQNLKSD